MPRLSVNGVLVRKEAAWKKKDQWRSLLSDAYELALPNRNLYDLPKTEGQHKMDKVFDSTLMTSTARFANRIQSELFPPFTKWANLVPGPAVPPNQQTEATRTLEYIRDVMFGAIQASDFDTAINEFLLDLAVGTGVMLIQEGDDFAPVRYVCVPFYEVALQQGAYGQINGVFRKYEIEARAIDETWPDAKFPDGWETYISDESTAEAKISLDEVTYYDHKEDTWYYDVLMHWKADKKEPAARIVERDLKENPWVVTRWIKAANEINGRGPVIYALPDAKTLNKAKELVLKNASFAMAGVWTAVDDGVLNPYTVQLRPGSIIPVQRNAGAAFGPSLQPLNAPGNFDVSQLVMDELKMSIKTTLFDDKIPDISDSVQSATYIIAKQRELQQDIGSPFGRILSELIRPLLQRTINILINKKILNIEGLDKVRVNGSIIDVQVISPLAKSQDLADVQSTVNWMQIVQGLGQEAFLLGAKVEDIPEYLSQKMGVDSDLVRSPAEREQLQQMVVQSLAAMQMAQQQQAIPAQQQGAQQPIAA